MPPEEPTIVVWTKEQVEQAQRLFRAEWFRTESDLKYLGGNVGDCFGSKESCLHELQAMQAAESMSGIPKASMGLTLLIMRLLMLIGVIIGFVLGTLTTFRFVTPHIKISDTDAGYVWRRFGKGP